MKNLNFPGRNKKQFKLTMFLRLVCMVISTSTVLGATRTWDNGAGDGVWTSAANWSSDIAPVSGDAITFSNGATHTITGMPAGLALTILTISGNTSVTFQASASNTITFSGACTIASGCTFTIGTNVIVSMLTGSSLTNAGTISGGTTAKLLFGGTASYTHSQNGGTIPTANWASTSTCNVTGMTSTQPAGLVTTYNTFGNFVWNCTSQSAYCYLAGSGENFTCNGDFTLSNSATFAVLFNNVAGGAAGTMTVGGNMSISNTSPARYFVLNNNTTNGIVLNVGGNLNCSSAIYTCNSSGSATVNVTGNVNCSGSDNLYGAFSSGDLTFNITGDINVSGGAFNPVNSSGDCTVNCTSYNVSGGLAYVTNNSGLGTTNVSGNITVSGTGAFRTAGFSTTTAGVLNVTGNITTSGSGLFFGTRSSSAGATINVYGDIDLSGGTSVATNFSGTTSGCTFNLLGTNSSTLKLPTGLNYDQSARWSWNIPAGKTVTLLSNVELGGTGSNCVFTNNGTLICGTYTFPALTSAVASVVIANGSTIKTAHLQGLSTTASTGTIQVTGTKTFHSGATYVFNGAAAQVSGNFGSSLSTANTLSNMEVNNASGLTLNTNITVSNSGTLTLTSGKLDIGNYDLNMGSTGGSASISGSGSSNYIITSGTGVLNQFNIGTGQRTSVTYPIGASATSYTPVTLNVVGSTTVDNFSARVFQSVYGNGSSGTAVTVNAVDRTWNITEGTTGGSNVTITPQWPASDELASFNRSNCNVYHYSGGLWTATANGAAASGSNPYTIVSGTVTSFSPFAVRTAVDILPIELLSFNAVPKGKVVDIGWTTATEFNNDYFTVERSTDACTFEGVAMVDGAGNSQSVRNYEALDTNPIYGLSYYRLKQTDFDGKYSYSDIVPVILNGSISNAVVYPNPTIDYTLLQFNSTQDEQIKVTVTDELGQCVHSHYYYAIKGTNQLEINLSHLLPGVYCVTLITRSVGFKIKVVKN